MTEKSDKPAKKTPALRKPQAAADRVKTTPKAKKPQGMTDAEFDQRVMAILTDFFMADAELQEDLRRPSRWARFFGIK